MWGLDKVKSALKTVAGIGKTVISYGWDMVQVGGARGHALIGACNKGLGLPPFQNAYYYFGIGAHASLSFFKRFFKDSNYKILKFGSIGAKELQAGTRFIPLLVAVGSGLGLTHPVALGVLLGSSVALSVSHRIFKKLKKYYQSKPKTTNCGPHFAEAAFDNVLDPTVSVLARAGKGGLFKEVVKFFLSGLADFGIVSAEAGASPWLMVFIVLPTALEIIRYPLVKKVHPSSELGKKLLNGYSIAVVSKGQFEETTGYDSLITAQTIGFLRPDDPNPNGDVTDAQGFSTIGVSAAMGIIAAIKDGREHKHKLEKMAQRLQQRQSLSDDEVLELMARDPEGTPAIIAQVAQMQSHDALLVKEDDVAVIIPASAYSQIAARLPAQSAPVTVLVAVQPTSEAARSPAVLEQAGDIELDALDSSDSDLETGDEDALIAHVARPQ